MAIKADFSKMNISLPGYDGFIKCPQCGAGTGSPANGGGAYRKSGPLPKEDGGVFYYSHTYCFECHFTEEIGKTERDAYLKRMNRL